MKKVLLILLFLFVVLLTISKLSTSFPGYPRRYIFINNQRLDLIVADTEQRKITGLSGATNLGDYDGMLFTFQDPGKYGFWMKDMKFPLDFIYLNGRYVVEILKNAQPSSYPHIFVTIYEFNSMIEVAAGTVDRIEVHVGDKVVYNDN